VVRPNRHAFTPGVRREISRIFTASIAAKRRFLADHLDDLIEAITIIAVAFERGNKLLIFGNGGSAADAQHIAAEFVNRFQMKRPGLPAIALTTDTSAITSIANDCGYSEVFARQVDALGRSGDVALAISTSGNSPSILRGVSACRRRRITTIGLTGGSGGRLARSADIVLRVGSTSETARIQETHILIGHVLCERTEALLFNRPGKQRRR
jgi:D-sedoheptulose 7-phosphate isomerase